MSNRAGTIEDALKSVAAFNSVNVEEEMRKRAQESKDKRRDEKKSKKEKKSKDKDRKKDRKRSRDEKKHKKSHKKSKKYDSDSDSYSSSSDDSSGSDSEGGGRGKGGRKKSKKDDDRDITDLPSTQVLLQEGREGAQSLRVLLGYFPQAKQDLRALFFSLDEGKAADLTGLEDPHLQSLLGKVLRCLRLAELKPLCFSLPKKWPHGDSIVRLLSQVLMEDPRVHGQAKEAYERGIEEEKRRKEEEGERARREEQNDLVKKENTLKQELARNPPPPYEIPDVVLPSDDEARDREREREREHARRAAHESEPAAPPLPRAARGPAMPPPEVLEAMASGHYQPTPPVAHEEEEAGLFDDLVGPAPPPDDALLREIEALDPSAATDEIKRILRVIREDSAADPYQILGVARTAAPGEIKKRYWKLSLLVHPDKNGNSEASVSAFQALTQAAEGLGDEERRRKVDEGLDDKVLWEMAKRDAAKMERENAWASARGEKLPHQPRGPSHVPLARDTWMTDMTQERRAHAKIEVGKNAGFATHGAFGSSGGGAGGASASLYADLHPAMGQGSGVARPTTAAAAAAAPGGIGPAMMPPSSSSGGHGTGNVNRPKSMMERHIEQMEREKEAAAQEKKKGKAKGGKEGKKEAEAEDWDREQHPWRPWDREKDLEIGPAAKAKNPLDMARAAAGLSDRFKSGGHYR